MNFVKKNELFLLEEIVKKNFASKYKDSVLGIMWSVLYPLSIMIMFTIIFSTLFKRNIDNFPVYFLSAKCIFDFFTGSVSSSMNAIKSNIGIIKQTAPPKYLFIIGGIISAFLNFIITLIILFGVMIVTNAHFYFSIMPIIIIPIVSTTIMVIGLGLMLSIACVYYSDIRHLWYVVSMMLMYSCALFYPMEIIPEPYHRFMVLNPLYWVVDQFRSIIFMGTIPQLHAMINSLLLSAIILIIGVIVFKKYEKTIIMSA